MVKETPAPLENVLGEFALPDGSNIKYEIVTDGMTAPVTLTFTVHKDGKPLNSLKTDSTLYFDKEGHIIGRVPLNTHTSAKKLKELYGDCLHKVLGEKERKLVAGFFLPGEFGIHRERNAIHGRIKAIVDERI